MLHWHASVCIFLSQSRTKHECHASSAILDLAALTRRNVDWAAVWFVHFGTKGKALRWCLLLFVFAHRQAPRGVVRQRDSACLANRLRPPQARGPGFW